MPYSRLVIGGFVLAIIHQFLGDVVTCNEPPLPWQTAAIFHKAPHEIEWRAAWHAIFEGDDPTVTYQLYTRARRRHVDFPLGGIELKLKLLRGDKEVAQKDFKLPANQIYTGTNSKVDSDSRFAVFRISLRDLIGKVPAGDYALSIAARSDSITLDGITLSGDEWLAGPVCQQKVAEFNPDQFDDSPSNDLVLSADLSKLNVDRIYCFATLANNIQAPAKFCGYTNGQPVARDDHVLCPCGLQVLVPGCGWFGHGADGLCGTGLGEVTISSGQAQAVRLWTSVPPNGVYRFVVTVTLGDNKKAEPKNVYSRGLVMRDGRATPLPRVRRE
jgi:hypothetical protein